MDRIVLLMDPLSNNCVQTLTHLSWREKQIAVRIKILLKYLEWNILLTQVVCPKKLNSFELAVEKVIKHVF